MSHHLVRGDDDDMEEMNAFGAHDEGDASTGFLSHDADDEDIGLVGGEVGGDHQYSGEGGLLREDSSMSAVNLPFVDLFPSIPKWKRVVVSSSVLFGLSLLFIIAATYNSLATSTNEVEGESSSMEAMMSTMAPMTTAAAALGQAITSSARDTRSYREMTLDNDSSGRRRHAQSTPGLRVVLVSDPTADTAAAAVNVGTGSMDNSQDLRGLAHFLEHMLFMGTEKYPNESEFDEFLSQHGGSYNAYTSDERTVYYFSVDHRYLAGSLDRFAQFFIAPVFSANSTSREVHAVNSEHSKNRQDDNWRGWELLKRAMNPAHPFSWFSTGTLETLWTTPQTQNIDVLQRLHAFHERFYFAENMRLVVLGRESLDQLEMLVRTSFGAMETGKSPIASPLHSHSTPVSLPSRMPHAFTVKPVLERKTLSLSFPTASFEAHDSTRPQDYVSHLIGHEGEGSLLAWLKQRGMATSLSAAAESYTQFGFFTIEIEITDAVATSLDAVDVVVAAVFDYIDTVVSPAPAWVFDENKHMALLSWDYPSKASPISYVQGIVNRMQHHIDEPENLLAPPSRLTFDKSHVDALVASLTPENVVVTVFAENVAGVTYDQLDAFYGTEFAEQMGTMELASRILKWKSRPSATGDFHLPPQPNPFIPSAVSLLSDSSPQLVDTAPHAVVEKPTYRGFHRLDVSFAVPKAQLSMLLVTDVPHASPRYNVLSSLYALLAMDAFGKTSYLGALAGCSDASFGVVRQGLEISVSCYSSGLDAFATQLVNAVRHGYQHLTASSFEALRDATEASLSDAQLAHAYTQAMRVEYETLMSRRFSTGDLLSQVRTVTLNQVVDFATNVLFADVSVDCIFYGNIDASTSMALTHSLAAIIAPTRLVQAPAAQTTVAVPPSGAFLQQRNGNTADTDSAIVVSMIASATTDDVTAIAHLSVLTQLLRQPTFDTLRTKEQLGYIVYGTSVTMGNRMAFEVIVQSALSPLLVRDRVHAFLDTTAPALIAAVTPLTLASTIDILRAQFRMVDLRMSQPSSRIYSEIALRRYTYDRRETIATALDSITVSSLQTFATSLLANRFTIETWGNNTTPVAPASATAVTSHALLFPSPCPCGQVQLMCDGSCVVGSQMGPATPVAACPRWQFFCD